MKLEDYIGIAFEDKGRNQTLDCWGLVLLYYRKEKGVALPDLSKNYASSVDKENIPVLVSNERSAWKQINDPRQGDVVVLNIGGKPRHVGIYFKGNKMLHIIKGINSCIENLGSPMWKNKVEGFYRFE